MWLPVTYRARRGARADISVAAPAPTSAGDLAASAVTPSGYIAAGAAAQRGIAVRKKGILAMTEAGIDVYPVRSVLFVPANREDRMRKSLTLAADAVIFDLESAIPRGEATVARTMVRDVLAGHTNARPRICRADLRRRRPPSSATISPRRCTRNLAAILRAPGGVS